MDDGRQGQGRPRVDVLFLGGTIASTDSGDGKAAPTLTGESLLANVPTLASIAQVRAASLSQRPGASLTFEDLAVVADEIDARFHEGADGIVVSQGTDTLEETAFFLDLVLAQGRPVVVTGAMRTPATSGADGPANLVGATRVAASSTCANIGVLVVMNDEIHCARFAQKVHTTSPSAFASPLCGPVGSITESRPWLATIPATSRLGPLARRETPPVAFLTIPLGDDGRLVRQVAALGYGGLVIEAMGGGHVPPPVEEALTEVAARIPVLLASRTRRGRGLQETYGFPGSETRLLESGLVSTGWLDGIKARVLLALLLASATDRPGIAQAFEAFEGGSSPSADRAPAPGAIGSGLP